MSELCSDIVTVYIDYTSAKIILYNRKHGTVRQKEIWQSLNRNCNLLHSSTFNFDTFNLDVQSSTRSFPGWHS
jgi:hypothetical protein